MTCQKNGTCDGDKLVRLPRGRQDRDGWDRQIDRDMCCNNVNKYCLDHYYSSCMHRINKYHTHCQTLREKSNFCCFILEI